nr:hypothetical protein [Acidobacteriota bacterium]
MRSATYADLLSNRGVRAFLWTQFLGAFNDNVFKVVVSMVAVSLAADLAAARLSWVGALFILPFLLFSGYAGQLADTRSKRTVLVWTKGLEVCAMLLGIAALAAGRLDGLLVVLFLMGTQSALFSPAKYGIVPELLPDLGLAIWGFLVSFRIPHVPAAVNANRMQPNPWAGLSHGFSRLRRDRTLALAVLGVAYFWFLGALLQLLILLVGKHTMALDDVRIAVMGAWLAVGIGAGSLAAGRLSGQKVELGLAPVGAFGMGACAIALSLAVPSYAAVCATVGLLGLFGGLFIVPLQALMQQRPAAGEKGQVIATGNLLSTGGVLLGSAVLLLGSTLQLSPERMILALGLMTLAASAYVLVLVPDYFIRFALWTLTHTVYRIRIVGQEHVPFRGPALLVCNHLSEDVLASFTMARKAWTALLARVLPVPLLRRLWGGERAGID